MSEYMKLTFRTDSPVQLKLHENVDEDKEFLCSALTSPSASSISSSCKRICLVYAILLFILIVVIPLLLKMTLYGEPSFYSLFPIYSILFSCTTIFEVIKRLRALQNEINTDNLSDEYFA
ncbi:unnamed protein product [Trichobilharzia szidati]|nr:unnamed protein product [Trichobilharzia szidati]